jgi:hypothetical protein
VLRGALEVVEFQPREPIADSASLSPLSLDQDPPKRLRLDRILPSCTAALASLVLHTFLVAPALWMGGQSRQPPPNRTSAGDSALQWVVLDDSRTAGAITPTSLIAAPALAAISLSDIPPTPPVGVFAPETSEDKSAQSEDRSSLGVVYGRYVGQIHARIDRAWRRPRTAIGAPIFQCQVQIDQDGLGRVGDVTLLQCNGDTRWQLSLVEAIEAASPLPAPANPAVFSRHLLLEFRAMAYSRGAEDGLYEPAAADGARDGRARSQNAFQALREAARAHSQKIINLRIEGSKAEVEPEHQ